MSILDITETPFKDDSIENYEYVEYLPIVGAVNNLNNPSGVISIIIETQDVFYHPSKSYLLIQGKLVKENDALYDNDEFATLTNNGLMYLFSNISYELSNKEIEGIMHPGWATTMLRLLKYDDDFSKSRGLNQLWYKDTKNNIVNDAGNAIANSGFLVRHDLLIKKPEPRGTFEFKIPLKHIFGVCEDYDKVVYGLKHALQLTRAGDNDAIFKRGVIPGAGAGGGDLAAVDNGKVVLERIAWYVPHVLATDKYKMELYKHIQSKGTFPVNYRAIKCDTAEVSQTTSFSWRLSITISPAFPRYIIVGFQTNKRNNQETNPAIFDNVNVKDIHVTIGSFKFPRTDYKLSFTKHHFSRAYGDASEFRSKFFFMDDLASNPNFTPLEYKELYPLFLFDVSKQSERLKFSPNDVHVKIDFEENVPAGTRVYAVVISDKQVNFQSDGNKMSVV